MKSSFFLVNLVAIAVSIKFYTSGNFSDDWIYLFGWLSGIATQMVLLELAIAKAKIK